MGLTQASTGFQIKKSGFTKGCDYTVALTGNPNTGKSTIFNALTGMHQHTGNWTGKTVGNAYGVCSFKNKKYLFVDLPGTYSLSGNSEEEKLAEKYIRSNNADVTVIIVDATRLERNISFVLQVFNLVDNVIVCVNLLDEAQKKGIKINLRKLSKELGVPVVGTVARNKHSIFELQNMVYAVCSGKILCTPIKIENDPKVIFAKSHKICENVCEYNENNYNSRDKKIDKILTSKRYGIPIMLLFLCLLFWITIVVANYPSEWLSSIFSFIEPYITDFLTWFHSPDWFISLLIAGIYRTVTWIVSVMLPPMAIFFPLFTLLEDLGYLPRIAFNLDKCFHKCQTSGKQALTMCMGFGCNAAGVIGCRIMSSTREKIIAILTNNFVPCNGRFPLIITISTIFFSGTMVNADNLITSFIATLVVACIVLTGIGFTFFVSSILSKTLLKGKSDGYVLELPPYRRPKIFSILARSFIDRTFFVLGRALSVAIPAGIVLWILSNVYISDVNLLNYIADFLDPFAKLIGLDGYILTAFILGFPANEIVLPIILMCYLQGNSLINIESVADIFAILSNHNWTALTALNVMLFSLFHFPCGTALLTIYKETQSKKYTFLSFILPTICGLVACLCTNIGWIIGSLLI